MYLTFIRKQAELDLLVTEDNNVVYDRTTGSVSVSYSGVWLPHEPVLVDGVSMVHVHFSSVGA